MGTTTIGGTTYGLYNPWWTQDRMTSYAAQTKIGTFLCPSDNSDARGNVFFIFHPDSSGTFWGGYFGAGAFADSLGRSNYLGCQGFFGAVTVFDSIWPYHGVMANRSKLSLEQWTAADGTSNTFFYGEAIGDKDAQGNTFSFCWMATGMVTAWGLPQPAQWDTYGSKHSGVVQFAMGDGAVRRVRKGITPNANLNGPVSYLNYLYAGGWNDGRPWDPSLIGN